MKKLLYITALACLFFSCKKKHTLKVTVVNKITDEAVVNANVYIIEETNKVESMGGGTVTHDFYNGYTDSEGLLYITKRFDRRYNYKVWCQTFDKTGTKLLYSYYMHGGDKESAWKNGITFEVIPQAYLKLSIHNVNCQGTTDTMVLERDYLTDPNYSVYIPVTLAGCFNDDGIYVKIPSGKYLIHWTVSRSGVIENGNKEIFIAPNEYKIDSVMY